METTNPLPPTDLRELTKILIRHYGLTSGRYQLTLGFRLGVGPIASPDGGNPIPGAIVGIENVSLIEASADAKSPDILDAGEVNPKKKRVKKPE